MKFIFSSYNPETGEATVVMQHMGVKFVGEAKCHPDEMDKASEYAGCKYAEIRAIIKALKYERKMLKMKSDMAIDLLKSCECYSNFNKDDDTAKVLYKQVNKRIKRVNDLTDEINNFMLSLDKSIKSRDIVLKAIDKRTKTDN